MTPEQREQLKACPFCGGRAVLQEQEPHSHSGGMAAFMPDHPGSFTIECARGGCNTGQIADTRAEVVVMWNRRAQVEALTVPQWISVEDRLPPIGQEVIVSVPGGRAPVTALMRLIRWEGATDFYWDNAYPGKGNMHLQTSITHWMPLPAAPAIPAITGTKEVES